jgi:peptidoglycan/LPS O-acetylase OafA/YrhL
LSSESRNLDLLRAIAVMLVYGSHLLSILHVHGSSVYDHLGRAGVMFFFVHTCLVLLLSLERTPLQGWAATGHFYVRRAFRIYPLSILTVCCVVAFRMPWMPTGIYTPVRAVDVAASLALVQNLAGSPEILGPLWSLPWEVQMYFAIPPLYLVLRKAPWKGIAWGLWAAALAARFAGLAGQIRVLSLLAYAPCFLAGGIAWRALRNGVRPRLTGALWPLAILAAGSIYVAVAVSETYQSVYVASYAACLFLGVTTPLFHDLPASRLTAAAHYVAKYSYGIYLSHVPLMWITHGPLAHAPGIVRWGFLAVSSAVVPVLLFHLVEDPLIRVGKRVASRLFERKQKAAHATA